MLNRILFIASAINTLRADKIMPGYSVDPMLGNTIKMATPPIYNKNENAVIEACAKKLNNKNLQFNGQTMNLAGFQSDPNYYKNTTNPIECVAKINQNFQKAKVAATETFNKVITSQKNPEKKCTYTMDKKANNCYISKFLDQITSHPMWNIVLHRNVVEIFNGTKLRKMIIFENFNYIVKNAVKNCITRFKNATAVEKHNAFGSVLEFIGDMPKEQKMECTPCGMGKVNKTSNMSVEGQGDSCSSCDPFSQLMGFQSKITELATSKSTKSKGKSSPKKNNDSYA